MAIDSIVENEKSPSVYLYALSTDRTVVAKRRVRQSDGSPLRTTNFM